jgi:hypothetical protein
MYHIGARVRGLRVSRIKTLFIDDDETSGNVMEIMKDHGLHARLVLSFLTLAARC